MNKKLFESNKGAIFPALKIAAYERRLKKHNSDHFLKFRMDPLEVVIDHAKGQLNSE